MKPVTDIRHLKVGGNSKTDVNNLYDEENYSSVGSGSRLSREPQQPTEDYHYSQPAITCMDVMEHIRKCPLCSKIYTPSGDLICNESGCSVKHKSASYSVEMNPLNIAIVILLLLIVIKIFLT